MKHTRQDVEALSLRIASGADRIRQQRKLVEEMTAANQDTWRAVQALNAMETTLSELVIQRDAMAMEILLASLAPPQDDNAQPP